MVPLIIFVVLLQPPFWNWIAAAAFILASISDWLDGYWARKYKAETDIGKLLDPVADKFLVSSVLILLIPLGHIEAILVLLLLNRDILIGGLRSMAAAEGKILAAGPLGKWKTGVQMVAIPALFINDTLGPIAFRWVGYWGLWLSLALSLFSGLQYSYDYFRAQPGQKSRG
jgi:CDP-diacylglycerol--glycerol-3-phosphate 3-phosphatidyltransferase